MEHLKTSDIILRKCLHRGWLCVAQGAVMHKSYNQAENIRKQQRTSENSWLHRKTSKIIWYHPENNWGPIIDSLVQFEEDFNSRTKMSVEWGGGDRLYGTRPIPRSPDGDKTKMQNLLRQNLTGCQKMFRWLSKRCQQQKNATEP